MATGKSKKVEATVIVDNHRHGGKNVNKGDKIMVSPEVFSLLVRKGICSELSGKETASVEKK